LAVPPLAATYPATVAAMPCHRCRKASGLPPLAASATVATVGRASMPPDQDKFKTNHLIL
jgi:hypothetical protein